MDRRRPASVPQGDDAVGARFAELYAQLKVMARRELGNSPRTSLDTGALVHEAYMKLEGHPLDVSGRGPFLALAAKAMRHVLVDHVRARMAGKRGGDQLRVTLRTDTPLDERGRFDDVLQIEQGLQALEQVDPRLVTVVECHFFAGMEFAEIAAQLGVHERTVYRDWRRARAFLQARLA